MSRASLAVPESGSRGQGASFVASRSGFNARMNTSGVFATVAVVIEFGKFSAMMEPLTKLDTTMTHANSPLAQNLDEGLRTLFGFDSFRAGQREAMDDIMAGRDGLVVMPTGSGKSLCYQLTACAKEGVTVVISPLIALMKDQVDGLQKLGLPATEINSSMSFDEQQRRIQGVRNGEFKLVYVAPERFRSGSFCQALSQVNVSMLAVDEAHCVSQWGHDFRPDYLRIADIRRQFGSPQTVALTATATRAVQRDIVEQLDMPDADIRVSGFERPNLFFEVFHARRDADKMARLSGLVDYYDGESVVVYCATRKQVRQVQKKLDGRGVRAAAYHGGMGDEARAKVQNEWMQGRVPVLVATNAFGMGVDKPDVRAVAHYNVPGSVEAYYQEAGRAGRDGEPAHCVLLFNYADKGIHEFFAENSYPLRTQVLRVWQFLCNQIDPGAPGSNPVVYDMYADRISRELSREGVKLHSFAVESSLRLLQSADHLSMGGPGQGIELLDQVALDAVRVDWESVEHRRSVADSQLANMLQYASSNGCLQHELLTYFNSESSFGERCEHCASCSGEPGYAKEMSDVLQRTVATDESAEILVKKLLAGVARARGKRGAHAVAAMLRGSKAKAVREAGFDRLSTHGICSALRQDDLVYLLDQLTAHGLLGRTEHGCVVLSERGDEVMRAQSELPDALERALARSLVEPSSAQTRKRKRRASRSSSSGNTYDTTLEMLNGGQSVAEIADARGIKERTVTGHLLKLAGRGDTFDLDAYLNHAYMNRLETLAGEWELGDPLRPLKDDMPDSCSYDELKIHLAEILMKRA